MFILSDDDVGQRSASDADAESTGKRPRASEDSSGPARILIDWDARSDVAEVSLDASPSSARAPGVVGQDRISSGSVNGCPCRFSALKGTSSISSAPISIPLASTRKRGAALQDRPLRTVIRNSSGVRAGMSCSTVITI